jgi:hypothetical protein
MMREDVKLLMNEVNEACRLYGEERSFFGWRYIRNKDHFSNILANKGLEELREEVILNENSSGFFGFIKSIFSRTDYKKSMLNYFDLMVEAESYNNGKVEEKTECDFVKKISSILDNFIVVIKSTEIKTILVSIKSKIDLLLADIAQKSSNIFSKILENKKENKLNGLQEEVESLKKMDANVDSRFKSNDEVRRCIEERMSRRDAELERIEREVQALNQSRKGVSF